MRDFKQKHGISFSWAMTMEPEKWFKTSKYHSKEDKDFDIFLRHFAERNPTRRWPAIRKLREWYKWSSEERTFIEVSFYMDEMPLRWLWRGDPQLSEVDAWIKKVDTEFEEYKQDVAFHAYIASLTPSEKEALLDEIGKHIEANFNHAKRLLREHVKT